jgi:hypothetical protein
LDNAGEKKSAKNAKKSANFAKKDLTKNSSYDIMVAKLKGSCGRWPG